MAWRFEHIGLHHPAGQHLQSSTWCRQSEDTPLLPEIKGHEVSSQYLGVAEAERVNQVMEKTHLPAFHVGQKGACIESPV